MQTDRRQMLKNAGFSLAIAGSQVLSAQEPPVQTQPGQSSSPFISVGPRSNGEASDTARLQRALDEAHQRGGGTVHIPSGRYIAGSLLLRSHVSIWLDNGAILAMSSDQNEFLHP